MADKVSKTNQIRDELLKCIAGRQWRSHQTIPSVRDLAKTYNSSTVSVQKALRELSKVGVIESRHRLGNFVADSNLASRMLGEMSVSQLAFVLPRWIQGGRANPSYTEILVGAEEEAARVHMSLLYASLPWDRNVNESSVVTPVIPAEGISGILLVGPTPASLAERFARVHNMPVVLVDNVVDMPNVGCVNTDNLSGAVRATEYLLRRGHRRIGMVAMDPQKLRVNERLAGFYAEMHRSGLTDQIAFIKQAEWDKDTMEGGYQVGTVLAKEGFNGATAILTINDTMAMGLIRAFREHNINVPRDISVMGIGDEPGAEICNPSLTTMRVDRLKIGRMGVRMLLDIVRHQQGYGEIHLLPMTLVERESVIDGPHDA
jgi:DNA-binding LacI/PurR family transcriptional regulator